MAMDGEGMRETAARAAAGVRFSGTPLMAVRPGSAAAPAAGGGSPLSLTAGEMLYAEGEPAEHWYEVVAGAVRACKLTPDGRRQVVEFHLPGDVFGLDEVDGVRGLTAEAAAAEGRTVVIRRCRRRLESMAEADPRFARRLHEMALRRLARAHARLVLLGRNGAVERVAAFLLEMETRMPRSDAGPGGFCLPMTREDVADHLALTTETVSRTLQMLKRRGAIALPGLRLVRILDRHLLQGLGEAAPLPAAPLPLRGASAPGRRLLAA
jgi:CRP-like cAMP-binding protein